MSAHTPGLLHVGEHNTEIVYDADGWAVCNATTFHGHHPSKQAENARRISACWNACQGVTTKSLEELGPIARAMADPAQARIFELEENLRKTAHAVQTATLRNEVLGAQAKVLRVLIQQARAMLQRDRDAMHETCVNPSTNAVDNPDDAAAIAEYDDLLQAIAEFQPTAGTPGL